MNDLFIYLFWFILFFPCSFLFHRWIMEMVLQTLDRNQQNFRICVVCCLGVGSFHCYCCFWMSFRGGASIFITWGLHPNSKLDTSKFCPVLFKKGKSLLMLVGAYSLPNDSQNSTTILPILDPQLIAVSICIWPCLGAKEIFVVAGHWLICLHSNRLSRPGTLILSIEKECRTTRLCPRGSCAKKISDCLLNKCIGLNVGFFSATSDTCIYICTRWKFHLWERPHADVRWEFVRFYRQAKSETRGMA